MRRHLLPLACGVWFVISRLRIVRRSGRAVACRGDLAGRADPHGGLPRRTRRGRASPAYSVSFRGRPVVLPSRLGIDLADGPGLGHDSTIEGVQTRAINETYTQHPGKRSRVVNHCEEVVVTLRERAAPARRWEVVLRAYDDGAALRYRFPAQEGWRRPRDRRRADPVPPARRRRGLCPAPGWLHHLARGPLPEEGRRRDSPRSGFSGLPLLAELPGTGWLAVMEANLTDYAGMYLARDAEGGAVLASRLSPRPGEPKVAVRADLPHESPWRVFMIADKVERLVESDLVLNLNAPCALGRYLVDPARQDDVPLVERLPRGEGPVQDGAEHGDGQVLHRLLRRGRHPVSLARRQGQHRLVRRADRPVRGGRHHPGHRRASTSARCSATPRRRASRSASGCTGRRPRPTWTGPSRSTASGASRG